MLVRVLALAIARGHDEIDPGYVKAERLDVSPLVESGLLSFKRHKLEDYVCNRCGGCDTPPHIYRVVEGGRTEFRYNCVEGEYTIPPQELAVYGINVDRLFALISGAFGCEAPQKVSGMDGAWDFGLSTTTMSKHPRRVVFIRRLDANAVRWLAENPNYKNAAIIISAHVSPDVQAGEALTAFAMPDVFRYEDGNLSVSLEPVKERFMARSRQLAEQKAAEKKPKASVLEKLIALADYLKDRAAEIMALYRKEVALQENGDVNGSRAVFARTDTAMNAVTPESIVDHFSRPDAQPSMKKSTIYNYLKPENYPDVPEANAARYWMSVCTDRGVMELTSRMLVAEYKHMIATTIHDKSGVELWMAIEKKREYYLRQKTRG